MSEGLTYMPFGASKFVELFLSLEGDLARHVMPELKTNPFSKLKDAHKMCVATCFSHVTAAINTQNLAPGLKMGSDGVVKSYETTYTALFPAELAPTDGQPRLGDQTVLVVFMTTRGDPFDDSDRKISWVETEIRDTNAEQLFASAALAFNMQQRTSLFTLLFVERQCRLLHWDRAALIVSEAFDYHAEWKFMCDVLWRLSVLHRYAPERLGADPSATRIFPSDPEWGLMDDAAQERETDASFEERDLAPGELEGTDVTFKYVRAAWASSLDEEWPRYRLEVPHGDAVRTLLVCRPRFQASSMIGRGTRGYVALEVRENGTGRFFWLKDVWRGACVDGMEREGSVLERLNKAGVENIPTLVCHGDVRDQRTRSHQYWLMMDAPASDLPPDPNASGAASSQIEVEGGGVSVGSKRKRADSTDETTTPEDDECPVDRHIHYRLVVDEVCMPLSSFTSGRQLVRLVIDGVVAHYMAVEQGVIHRDVSSANLLIFPKVKTDEDGDQASGKRYLQWLGLLSDWELSTRLDRLGDASRVGTDRYMSVALLQDRKKTVEISDELESFTYVLIENAVQHLRSNCPNADEWLQDFFHAYKNLQPYGIPKYDAVCGDATLVVEIVPRRRLRFKGPMDRLLKSLLAAFKASYDVREYDSWQETRPASSPPPAAASSSSQLLQEDDISIRDSPSGSPSSRSSSPSSAQSTPPPPPSEEDRRKAEQVASHAGMLRILYNAMLSDKWGACDRIDGQCAQENSHTHWTRTLPLAVEAVRMPVVAPAGPGRNKRRRVEESS
ncbi:hypothetical protein C8Q76DRAFT_648134 [Earliella scabrosa]|nr:hypothetical protein C8Q76DRAFT_648134 [Earliella scabrosa]